MTKRKTPTPTTQQKIVLFGAADKIKWASSRKEYVPKGSFVATFALCLPITSNQGVGYGLSRTMAGLEVDDSGAVCDKPCQWYHAVPHQTAK